MTYTPMAFFPANFILQTDDQHHHHQPSPFLSSPPQDFQGTGVCPQLGKRSMSFSGFEVGGGEAAETNMEDDLSDDGLMQLGEKKKRLNMVQVKTLEKSFELGNKLEPERKMQLARALGLQPRQIAIWFQNRRARWKTKQLEKDYDLLKRQFDAIKQENDSLLDNNKKLHSQIMALKNRENNNNNNNTKESINLNKETEGSCSNRSDNSSEMRFNNISAAATPPPQTAAMDGSGPLTSGFGPLYPSSIRPSGSAQFIQHFSTRPEFMNQKLDVAVKEENLCSMFGFDDQNSGFWPWMDQQNYN